MENLKELVKDIFPGLFEPELQEAIVEHGELKSMDAGEYFMDIGQPIEKMPLLVSGVLKVVREDEEGNEVFLYYVEEGSTCTMSLTCCMTTRQSQIRAEVEQDATAILVPVRYMDEWMVKYPSWRQFVMGAYAFRFEEMLHMVDLLAFHKMDERLLSYLKNQTEVKNSRELKLSHADIARDLNTSREVISRLLKKLEKDGRVKLGRNKVSIPMN